LPFDNASIIDEILFAESAEFSMRAASALFVLNKIPKVQDGDKVGFRIDPLFMRKIRRFYFDTALSAGPQVLGSLLQVADHDKILFGSDWPYCPEIMATDMITQLEANPLLDEKLKRAIARGNALGLFPRLAA